MELDGLIISYRRSGSDQDTRHIIIEVLSSEPPVVRRFVGGVVLYRDGKGNVYRGRILRHHGKKGNKVIARFTPNLPGQALGRKVRIILPE